ncbi:hypothetical protein [Chryseobacterium sp. Alg-005]|uniref:hypothetical protein n=1 Tax=Chryseobacterium sp. Alg-005 TaxID=3159516 RepID=UPI0036F23E8D
MTKLFQRTEILIITFLWLNILFSFINIPYSDIFLNLGIAGLILVSVLYIFRPQLSTILLIFLLAIGIINLVSFNNASHIRFMGFNIVNFLLFVILVYKKGEMISDLREKWLETTKEEIADRRSSQIEIFKKRFENLDDESLKDKLQKGNITDEAKQAIRQILIERKQ